MVHTLSFLVHTKLMGFRMPSPLMERWKLQSYDNHEELPPSQTLVSCCCELNNGHLVLMTPWMSKGQKGKIPT